MPNVYVYAKQFHGSPVPGARITDLHGDGQWVTGMNGYARIDANPGRRLTLVFHAAGFPDAQTATVTVPQNGLMSKDDEVTFEVPKQNLYRGLVLAFGKARADTRHVVTTVLSAGSTLHNNFGEPGATVMLVSADGARRTDPLYLAAKAGEGKHTTSWPSAIARRRLAPLFPAFAQNIGETRTTVDGGVIFPDVPYGEYRIVAEKPGVSFSEARVIVRTQSPAFINASPPHGPKVTG